MPRINITLLDSISQSKTEKLSAIVDTGSDGTIVPLFILQEAGFLPNRQRRRLSTSQTTIEPETVMGFSLDLQIEGIEIQDVDIYGSRTVAEVILGRNLLNRLVFTYDGPNLLLELVSVD